MRRAVVIIAVGLVAACGSDADPTIHAAASSSTSSPATTTTSTTATTVAPTTTAPATTVAPPPPPTEPPPPAVPPSTIAATALPPDARVRQVVETGYAPYATTGGITLHHTAARVERIGFHQSNNDGAQHQDALPTAAVPTVLEDRGRDTDPQGAADIVVDPAAEIRAPVTGTVIRAGTYTLYCEYSDDYVVIEPDEHPGWEVKILHINHEQVSAGDRVVAGETVIAPNAHVLPFTSDVDELRTADPAWPHTHVEVVDPTVPDRPTPGGCG